MRLTSKEKLPITNQEAYLLDFENDGYEIANKLGRLEDIEGDIGIDLITLFKALEQGIDMNIDKGYRHVELIGINEGGVIVYEDNPDGYTVLPYDDFGKTWALAKEE